MALVSHVCVQMPGKEACAKKMWMIVRLIHVIMAARVSTVLTGFCAHALRASLDQCVKSTSTNATLLHAVMAPLVKIKLTALNAYVPPENLDRVVKMMKTMGSTVSLPTAGFNRITPQCKETATRARA